MPPNNTFNDWLEKRLSKDIAKKDQIKNSMTEKKTQLKIPIKKLKQNILSFLQFLIISGIVFCIIFFTLNWNAYIQIISRYFQPENSQKIEVALTKSVKSTKKAQNLIKINHRQNLIKKQFPPLGISPTPYENRLIIPKIGKNIPIIELNNTKFNSLNSLIGKEFEGAIQEGLQKGVIHYPGTAQPGQFGNFFLTGHSSYYPWDPGKYKDVFALLEKLEIGDEYYVYFKQKKYIYRIITKKVVSPSDISVLDQPKDTKTSTLMTCTPVGTDLRRLILVSQEV